MALYTQARRRGQMLSNRRRNVTMGGAGIANPRPQLPGQTPPIIPGVPGQTTPVKPPVPHGPNAQGYSPIHYGALGKQIGYAKVGQARNQPGGVPAPAPGVPAPAGFGAGGPPPALLANAEKFGYNVIQNNQGQWIIKDPGVGYHQKSPEEIAFLQHAANKFNLGTPGIADFNNSQYVNGDWYHLNTGQGNYDGDIALNDDMLARARARAGWTPAVGQAHALAEYKRMQKQLGNPGSGELPAWLATPEGYQAQIASQRANVAGQAGQSNWQLGSDGQYHDMNAPLPPGVELKPPEGATAPLTQDPSKIAEAAHGTPQAALNAGKDPTKHMAYWEDKGWTYNPATDQWTNRNAPAAPASTPAPAAAPAQAGAASPTMPLDPAYIAAQRAAQLQLNSTLQGVDPALEQINAQNQLALARMNTNQGVDTQALMEALSSRGALQSSIYGTERGNLATNYMRTGQDLAADVANAQSQVYQTQQQGYNDYYASLIEALLASANNSATSEYTPVGNPNRKPRNKNKNKRGNNRGRS